MPLEDLPELDPLGLYSSNDGMRISSIECWGVAKPPGFALPTAGHERQGELG